MTTARHFTTSRAIAVSLCVFVSGAGAVDTSANAVGEASMTIGSVRATSADGASRVLERGALVRVRSRINFLLLSNQTDDE